LSYIAFFCQTAVLQTQFITFVHVEHHLLYSMLYCLLACYETIHKHRLLFNIYTVGHFTFWISFSLSEIAKHTHRPQGVNYHGYLVYMSSNIYYYYT